MCNRSDLETEHGRIWEFYKGGPLTASWQPEALDTNDTLHSKHIVLSFSSVFRGQRQGNLRTEDSCRKFKLPSLGSSKDH